jgi:hypothetical protein
MLPAPETTGRNDSKGVSGSTYKIMTKIENAIEQVRAMDSKTVNELIKTLEGISKLSDLNRPTFFDSHDAYHEWLKEFIGDSQPFPEIYDALRSAASHFNHKRLISEIIVKGSIDRGDSGEPILTRKSVTFPHFGTYILSLDDDGTFTASCGIKLF